MFMSGFETSEMSDPKQVPSKNPETGPTRTASPPSDLFKAGNYVGAARLGDPDRWETFAALALIGRTDEALAGLDRFGEPAARFYEAAARWMAGRDDEAARRLERLPGDHARDLLSLIRRPRIRVLAQLPFNRAGSSDFLSALPPDGRFWVENISFVPGDRPNEPNLNILKHVDPAHPPDFYVAKNVEWHLVPPNLGALPCPTFGVTADFDLHIQALYPCLQIFDALIVNDHTEWRDARGLVRVPVLTYPKAFGLPPGLPPVPEADRPIDVFQSGFILHPYHPDKAAPCLEMLSLPENRRVYFFDGFTNANVYFSLLGQSKSCYTFVRHPGAMPTRGLEALSMGCAAAVQEGSTLALYFGPDEGIVTYRPEKGHLAGVLNDISENWRQYEEKARRGAARVRKEFALPVVADQYLRFLTIQAADPRFRTRRPPVTGPRQKRMVTARGWLPGPPPLMEALAKSNLDHWEKALRTDPAPGLFNDIGRELALLHVGVLEHIRLYQPDYPPPSNRLTDMALEAFAEGVRRYPRSLPLRFNLIRCALHLGNPDQKATAVTLAGQTLETSPDQWSFDALDDVFPWDFFPAYFNYRRYFDLLRRMIGEGANVGNDLVAVLLASLHHYLSHHRNPVRHAAMAATLDPDFAVYKLRLARLLVESAGNGLTEGDRATAEDILFQLAEGSILFPEAFELLKKMEAAGLAVRPVPETLARAAGRYRRSLAAPGRDGIPLRPAGWRETL